MAAPPTTLLALLVEMVGAIEVLAEVAIVVPLGAIAALGTVVANVAFTSAVADV